MTTELFRNKKLFSKKGGYCEITQLFRKTMISRNIPFLSKSPDNIEIRRHFRNSRSSKSSSQILLNQLYLPDQENFIRNGIAVKK
jgi:hypothetical protein